MKSPRLRVGLGETRNLVSQSSMNDGNGSRPPIQQKINGALTVIQIPGTQQKLRQMIPAILMVLPWMCSHSGEEMEDADKERLKATRYESVSRHLCIIAKEGCVGSDMV